jgi:hypothetical protein
MSINSQIQYYTHKQVDKVKWDAVIESSPNGLIYGYSFYLDHMAKHWDALVLNDYEAVMPLTWNKKYGIYYLYQPFLCASLGVFGKDITAETTKEFLLNIPEKFRYRDISLNHGNLYTMEIAGLYERKNFVLNLQEPYDILYNRFSDNVKRNIKKAAQNGCLVLKPSFPEILQLAKPQLKQFMAVTHDDIDRFSRLYYYLEQKNVTATYGIAAEGKLLSSCVFFFWRKRAYYILVGNHAGGKATGASHALLNAFIKDHAGTGIILDFEGSDIPGLALFYSSFGAPEENYPAIKLNRLPALVKWLKK